MGWYIADCFLLSPWFCHRYLTFCKKVYKQILKKFLQLRICVCLRNVTPSVCKDGCRLSGREVRSDSEQNHNEAGILTGPQVLLKYPSNQSLLSVSWKDMRSMHEENGIDIIYWFHYFISPAYCCPICLQWNQKVHSETESSDQLLYAQLICLQHVDSVGFVWFDKLSMETTLNCEKQTQSVKKREVSHCDMHLSESVWYVKISLKDVVGELTSLSTITCTYMTYPVWQIM